LFLDLSKTRNPNKKLCPRLSVLAPLKILGMMVCKILYLGYVFLFFRHCCLSPVILIYAFFWLSNAFIISSSRNWWIWTCWSGWYIDSFGEVRILGWSGQLSALCLRLCSVTTVPLLLLHALNLPNFAVYFCLTNIQKATKWSERKEAVAELTKLASTKRISPGDFSEVCRTLKKVSCTCLCVIEMMPVAFSVQKLWHCLDL